MDFMPLTPIILKHRVMFNQILIGTSHSSSNNDENYTKSIKGNSGVSATAQAMVKQFRQNIIAVDRDIINQLNVLFLGIY